MGSMSAEQTVAIIESVSNVVEKTQDKPNYWWLLSIAIVPIVLTWILRRRK